MSLGKAAEDPRLPCEISPVVAYGPETFGPDPCGRKGAWSCGFLAQEQDPRAPMKPFTLVDFWFVSLRAHIEWDLPISINPSIISVPSIPQGDLSHSQPRWDYAFCSLPTGLPLVTGYAAYDAHHSGTRVFWVGGHGTGSA